MKGEADVESELIRKCRQGDGRFYEPLVRAYEAEAQRVALGLLRDPDAARDAVQESFIRAYRALDRFELGRPFRPWLLRILRNHCRDLLRRGKARPEVERMDVIEERVASSSDPEAEHRRAESRALLWEALGRIGDDHREVLVLKELDGLSYGEIAESVGVPEGTVASRLYHARRALREALEAMGVSQ